MSLIVSTLERGNDQQNEMWIFAGILDLDAWTHNLRLGGLLYIVVNGRWMNQGNATYGVEFYDTDCTFKNDTTYGTQNLGHVKVD